MKEKIKVFPAKRKHRSEMKAVNEKCLTENYGIEYWEELVAHKNSFVIQSNSLIVGYILVDKKGHVVSFAILQEHRKKGYGETLLKTMLEHLASVKCPQSSLNVRVSNAGAIKLYKKYGYVEKDTSKEYYSDKEDAYNMIKTF